MNAEDGGPDVDGAAGTHDDIVVIELAVDTSASPGAIVDVSADPDSAMVLGQVREERDALEALLLNLRDPARATRASITDEQHSPSPDPRRG